MRSLGEEEKREVIGAIDSLTTFKNTEQGAATSVWCAISPTLDGMGGVYCEDVDIAEAVAADFTGPGGVRPWATDPAFAEHLWTLSEKMTGVTFEGL